MIRRPPRSTRTDTLFPTRRSSDLLDQVGLFKHLKMLGRVGYGHRRLPGDLLNRTFSLAQQVNDLRSEEHTSELQSLMRISYAVFCLKKKTPTSYSVTQSYYIPT